MKTCFKCQQTKPLDDFYRHPGMADGRLGKCKSCTRSDVRSNRERNAAYYRQYDRDRTGTPRRLEHLKRNCKKFRAECPEKYRAHSLLSSALRCGRIEKRPCEICGNSRVHAHHEDYSKPLDVRWLCVEHHKARHRELEAAA